MSSIIRQWKRLSQEDPISKLIRRITRDEIAIDNIELDLGLTYFYFPHICDLLASNWTLISTAGAIYWKTTDAVGEIDKPFFIMPLIFPTTEQFMIESISMVYHVENALTVGPKIQLHHRNESGESDTFTASTVLGPLSDEGPKTSTIAAIPHIISTDVHATIDVSIPTKCLLAIRITFAQQANDADLRVIGFYIKITRIRPGRTPI